MEKIEKIFKDGVLFIILEASLEDTVHSILADPDKPKSLVALKLSECLFMIYQKSKKEI